MPKSDSDKKRETGKNARSYMRYAGMVSQMGVIIFLGTFAGKKFDAHFQFEHPYLTVLFALCSIAIALYISLKDLLKND